MQLAIINPIRLLSWTAAFVALAVLPGTQPSAVANEIVPDFALVDTNGTSSTSGQSVSPRDYLQMTSAWYFGHST